MNQRLLILADGEFSVFGAKTAVCLLRYRAADVVGVFDREHAGKRADEVVPVPCAAPVVGTLKDALALRPDTLVLGIAPPGGRLPESWRSVISGCLAAGVHILSGLHTFLADDEEFSSLAYGSGSTIVDLRRPPVGQPVGLGKARGTRARRVLTVGTDCNVGKMVCTFELEASARTRGVPARLVATGQTGMMIAGTGVTLDRIPGDFIAGWCEQLVLEADGTEPPPRLILVEGQGCLLHPAYSGVTLAQLHGALPDAMILVHHAGRETIRYTDVPIPPLSEWVRRYEDAVGPIHPGRVVGIAINPHGLSPSDAREAIRRAEDETCLPAVDVVTEGADRLLEALIT